MNFRTGRRGTLEGVRYSDPLERVTKREPPPVAPWDDEMFREQRDRDLAEQPIGWRRAVGAVFVALLVAGAFSTAKLVEIAERMELGAGRDRALGAAEFVDDAAHSVYLDRPATWIADLRNTGDDAGQQVDVIDESLLDEGQVPPETTAALTVRPAATSPAVQATTTVDVEVLRLVTPGDPLRVFVGGDSQAEYLSYALESETASAGVPIAPEAKWQISTGLARPDVFNWPAELAARIDDADPEAVVLFLGANDHQDMQADSGVVGRGSDAWQAEYRRRVGITFDLLEDANRRVFWVAQPPMQDGRLNEGIRLINDITQDEASRRPWVVWVDAYNQFGGDFGFSTFMTGPDGSEAKVRAGDGVHLTQTGADWLAAGIVGLIEQHWEMAPA